MSLIVPTVYSVIAADATIDRPGSTLTSAVTPASRHAPSTASPHSVSVGACSPAT